jgi:hypothetical protein
VVGGLIAFAAWPFIVDDCPSGTAPCTAKTFDMEGLVYDLLGAVAGASAGLVIAGVLLAMGVLKSTLGIHDE